MKQHTEVDGKLEDEARNLLSVAYKNVVGSRRSSWRVVSSMIAKEQQDSEKQKRSIAYLEKIVVELDETCTEVLVCLHVHITYSDLYYPDTCMMISDVPLSGL